MNKTRLAKNLDISRTMLYKLEARGMPTNKGLEAAIEWRRHSLDVTQTKNWRIDGNKGGVNHELTQINYSDELEALHNVDLESELNQLSSKLEHEAISKVLTHTVPEIWFERIGAFAAIMRDHGVKISAETLFKVQGCLYLVYMGEVIEFLEEDEEKLAFHIGDILNTEPEDQSYPSLMARLNQILEAEPTNYNQSK